ncbi:adenosylcobinamide-GDP ribazoletransferase [Sneathiella glossodoripedis]|uniref:adenosylcobinamide-GDP ribazoletransferase n=1 Tax=Sneathiella glossodoripedis TaxID=418853 RepID=UPI0004715493|nr:adenosylcobinamide-GDP ribazoletransferase [Sneathiella glossodoripedis]
MTNSELQKKYNGSWVHDFLIALVFLTRLPVRLNIQFSMKNVGLASRVFALIGIIVGGLSAGVYWLAFNVGIPPVLGAMLAVSAQIILTGALHEDAIGDVADGFGGGVDKDKKLEIMRDSRVGTYAVVTLILIIGIKVSAIASYPGTWFTFGILLSAATCSRGLMGAAMYFMPAARADGLGASAGRPPVSAALTSLAFAIIIPVILLGPYAGSIAVFSAIAGALFIGFIAYRQIGGQTGDVLGSIQQISECAFFISMAAFIS